MKKKRVQRRPYIQLWDTPYTGSWLDVLMEEAAQSLSADEEEPSWSNEKRRLPRKVHPYDPAQYFLQ